MNASIATLTRWRRSLERLVRCGRSLGLRLGWRYWRIQNRALVNPWLALEWADNCDREAERLDAMNEGLLANAHRQWAAELRTTYDRWRAPNSSSAEKDKRIKSPLDAVQLDNPGKGAGGGKEELGVMSAVRVES
jgi:hypothetical protein